VFGQCAMKIRHRLRSVQPQVLEDRRLASAEHSAKIGLFSDGHLATRVAGILHPFVYSYRGDCWRSFPEEAGVR
jgi:hypothetical protein